MTALLLVALALATPAPKDAATGEPCSTARMHHADERAKPAKPRKLGELPPGSLELAVMRHVDNCPTRAIVRTGYGARR